MEQFTDANLLTEFCNGNREAIRQVCKTSAKRIEQYGLLNDENVVDLLRQILGRIGEGQSPDEAFGWFGKTGKNTSFRDWNIRMAAREMLIAGENLTWACGLLSSDSGGEEITGYSLSFSTVAAICAGLTKDTPLPLPDNIFPIQG